MKYFDVAQGFVERCQRTPSLDELKRAFERAVQELGFRYFACCSHVDPLDPPPRAVMFQTYPEEWVQRFSHARHYLVDPVFSYADRTLLPFSWDDSQFLVGLSGPQRKILSNAQALGIAHGITVPIHLRWALPASCSVVPDSLLIDRGSYLAVFLMAVYLYETLRRDVSQQSDTAGIRLRLPERERQCLELAAQGKTDWATGAILGISERTVHNHIESAKRRLGVVTRVQAIVQALFEREISFGDVMKAQHPERPAAGDDPEPSDNP